MKTVVLLIFFLPFLADSNINVEHVNDEIAIDINSNDLEEAKAIADFESTTAMAGKCDCPPIPGVKWRYRIIDKLTKRYACVGSKNISRNGVKRFVTFEIPLPPGCRPMPKPIPIPIPKGMDN